MPSMGSRGSTQVRWGGRSGTHKLDGRCCVSLLYLIAVSHRCISSHCCSSSLASLRAFSLHPPKASSLHLKLGFRAWQSHNMNKCIRLISEIHSFSLSPAPTLGLTVGAIGAQFSLPPCPVIPIQLTSPFSSLILAPVVPIRLNHSCCRCSVQSSSLAPASPCN